MSPPAVAVAGAAGRMGQAVMAAADADSGVQLAAAIEAPDHPQLGSQRGSLAYCAAAGAEWDSFDVLIDFSLPASAAEHASLAAAGGCALVIGTTGLNSEQLQAIEDAAGKVPVLHAPNMSMGVNMLFRLAAQAAAILPDWDAEILELHHRHKIDAPSGTAVRLGEIVARSRPDSAFCHDRTVRREQRPQAEIGFAVLRAGDAVGDHTVLLGGTGERLELTHRSSSRATYATGAVAAAKHIAGRKPGRYAMDDVLAARLEQAGN